MAKEGAFHQPIVDSPPHTASVVAVQLARRSPRLSPASKQALARLSVPLNSPAYNEAQGGGDVRLAKKRSQEEIVAERGDLPPGFPSGPWPSHKDAQSEVSNYCRPGFSVKLHGYKPSTSKSGAKAYLLCHLGKQGKIAAGAIRLRGSALTNCQWKVSIEEANEGWVISKVHCTDHNHPLAGSTVEALAHSTMRSIPGDMADFGSFLKQAGMSPAEIFKYERILFTMSPRVHPTNVSSCLAVPSSMHNNAKRYFV